MPRYLNTSGATLSFQGVVFEPGGIHDVPVPIHSRIMYPTSLPCTGNSSAIDSSIVESTVPDSANTIDNADKLDEDHMSDVSEASITPKKSKTKASIVKEENNGTDNDK